MVVVERTKPLEGWARGTQVHIGADDIDDIVGFLDLLDQGYPFIGQGAPACRRDKRNRGNGPSLVPSSFAIKTRFGGPSSSQGGHRRERNQVEEPRPADRAPIGIGEGQAYSESFLDSTGDVSVSSIGFVG